MSETLASVTPSQKRLPCRAADVLFAGLSNCRVGSCNHTFVADSFEKRDDLRIARKFVEFFYLTGHHRGSLLRR